MTFPIGPNVYRVVISQGKLRYEDGEEVCGLFCWVDHAVYLCGVMDPARRLEVLFHELRHAWRHHFGKVFTDEDDANNAASFVLMCHRELLRQGGERALMRMPARPCKGGWPRG